MSNQENNFDQSKWAGIIRVVRTPLGFFALVVLALQVALAIGASLTSGIERTVLVIAMPGVLFLMVIIVSLLAYSHPQSLYGTSPPAKITIAPADSELLNEKITNLMKENNSLKCELEKCKSERDEFTSLKTRVFATLHHDTSISIHQIRDTLDYEKGDKEAIRDIWNAIGILIDERKIEGDRYNPGYYRRKIGTGNK